MYETKLFSSLFSGLASPMTESAYTQPPHSAPPAANQQRQKSLEGIDNPQAEQPQRMMIQKPQPPQYVHIPMSKRSNSAPASRHQDDQSPQAPDPDEQVRPNFISKFQ